MHDPMTVAFDVKLPWPGRKYGIDLLTIWHVDPETDGSDDSCGWFKRARHGDKATLEKIAKAFAYEWHHDHGSGPCGWFHPVTGHPIMSVQATALELFRRAAYIHFKDDWRKTDRFMRRNLYDILQFAENTTDSMRDSMVRWVEERREDRIHSFAAMTYGWILRAEQPWYRHARWHLHHWRIQFRPWQTLRRWLFDRCCKCGKRFHWGESPVTHNWDSPRPKLFRSVPGIFHSDCRHPGQSGAAQASAAD